MPSATRSLKLKVEIDGEKEYKEAIAELNQGNRTLRSEMALLQEQYRGNENSQEALTARSQKLEQMLLQQRDKVQKLREAMENAARQAGESADETQEWAQKLNYAQVEEIKLQRQLDETNKALAGQGEEMVSLGDTVGELANKFGITLPKEVTTAMNSMDGFSMKTVAALGIAAGAVAALIAAFKSLNDITLQVAADADEYLEKSAITGVPVEMLQAWDYAAPLIDTDVETITGAMTKLTKAMGDAAGGSEATQEKFAELGVSITDSEGHLRDSQDVLMDVIDALGQMENGTERDAAAMALLGKNAQELNPLIEAGSGALKEYADEAKELGFVLDEDQIEKLGEVDDSYQRVQLTVEALKKQMAADFAPAAKAAMDLFSDVVQKAGDWLKRSGLIENLASIVESVIEILRTMGELVTNSPMWETSIKSLNAALSIVAYTFASIADLIKIIVGLMPGMWGSGMLKEGLGLGYSTGNANSVQRLTMSKRGTLQQYDDYYSAKNNGFQTTTWEDAVDPKNLWVGTFNASGNDNWRGGLTWVGEAGPELVALPGGSQIYNAQDSRNMGGDTFYITIDAASVKEFNDIVEMARSARVRERMR